VKRLFSFFFALFFLFSSAGSTNRKFHVGAPAGRFLAYTYTVINYSG